MKNILFIQDTEQKDPIIEQLKEKYNVIVTSSTEEGLLLLDEKISAIILKLSETKNVTEKLHKKSDIPIIIINNISKNNRYINLDIKLLQKQLKKVSKEENRRKYL